MPLRFLNEKSLVFTGANPHAVSEYVNLHVGSHNLRLSHNRGAAASLSHRKAGSLDLCRLRYGAEARVVSEGLPYFYHVQFILNGHCRYDMHRESMPLSAGHVLLINPEEPIDLTYSADCEKFIVKVPSSLFDQACTEHRWFKPNERVKFNQTPYKFEELQSLLALLQLVCQEAESTIVTPQMLQHYSRVVTSKLMTMLKHNVCLTMPTPQSFCFDRLAQYVEDNIKRDITMEELVKHSHLSLRSLYLLFEKNANTTPKHFIRKKKLEAVYATLMDPSSNAANVTAVALDYGFTHLGRFSELYRSTFGVLPSEALKARCNTV
ncbi:MAG TPA: AraC family transcriptional regulator [Oxalobacteraceae bacterium]|nr:AraC family transcriptional regulator [Oxalobacteraceae bacterium]